MFKTLNLNKSMRIKLISSVIAGAALVVVQAQAAPNLLVNSSFETMGTGNGSDPNYTQSGFDSIPGWFSGGVASDSGSQTVADKTSGAHTASYDAGAYGYLMIADSTAGIYANQTTATTITSIGEPFTISFGASANGSSDNTWTAASAAVHYYIYSGATLASGHIMGQGFSILPPSPGEGGGAGDIPIWSTITMGVTAGALDVGQPIGIAIKNTTGIDGGLAVNSWELIDGVTLIQEAPEPTTIALLGLGGLALVAFRRRA
jgi:PEP-CTERM motif